MPRRPPRKPDPALDLSAHLLQLDGLAAPCDPVALFPTPAPVELEVGSGKGLFLATASATRSYASSGITGPKTSSRASRIVSRTPASSVG